jgi:hypothetical protein
MVETPPQADKPEEDWLEARKIADEKPLYLPPIHRLKLPETRTQSALIRWLWELGYPVKAIHKGLNVRYQQVRNIVTTEPKRAAREDMPPLRIELAEMEDVVDTLLGQALEADFLAARKAERRKRRENIDTDEEEEEDVKHV